MTQPKLLERVRCTARLRHLSLSTERTYSDWIRRFILFHDKRHPSATGADEIRQFLSHLAVSGRVAASTQNQALCALLFLYREVLNVELPYVEDIERAKRPTRVPVVFTRDEVGRLRAQLTGTHRLVASLLYGAGLRLMEALRLRVKDVDFVYGQITARAGKGEKDRRTVLPRPLAAPLPDQLARVRLLHAQDLREGFGAVRLPYALERKYPGAARELAWQYVFPSANRAVDPRGGGVQLVLDLFGQVNRDPHLLHLRTMASFHHARYRQVWEAWQLHKTKIFSMYRAALLRGLFFLWGEL